MVEAIGLGASVVAFIGLAGQIAQGCSFVRTVIEDIRDAPDDLRALEREIRLFEVTIETFQKALSGLEDSGIPGHQEPAVQMALDCGEETMGGLLEFVLKKKKKVGRWGQIRFAFDKAKCAKYVGQVERAKGYLTSAQAGILLSFGHEHTLSDRFTHRNLGLLKSTTDTTSDTIERIPPYLDNLAVVAKDTHNAVENMRSDFAGTLQGLPTAIDTILTGKFNAFTSMVSEALGTIEEVRHTTQQTREAAQNLTAVSDGLKCLPKPISQSIHIAFQSVLDDFYWESQTQGPTFSDNIKEYPQAKLGGSSRRVISQHTTTRRYHRAIGIITVHSTTTNFIGPIDHNFLEAQDPRISTVTQTYVELNPNPDLIRIGVYCLIAQQGFASFQSTPEPKLRVYNVIDSTAPIVRACKNGDLQTVRTLFSNGQASPFDRIWGEKSLLDLVMLQVILNTELKRTKHIESLVTVFGELISCGLDPGARRSNEDLFGKSILGALGELTTSFPQGTHHFLILARMVLKQSVQDPFLADDILLQSLRSHVTGVKTPMLVLLQTQEEWHTDWPPLHNFQECRDFFLTSKRFATLIHSRSKRPSFWGYLLYYQYDFERLIFNGCHEEAHSFGKDKKPINISSWICGLLEQYGDPQPNFTERGLVWLFKILELSTNYETYGRKYGYIRQGMCFYSIEGETILYDTFEEELYNSLAYQLIYLVESPKHTTPYGCWFPASLQYTYVRANDEDCFIKRWNHEYPQPHDQPGRFGPVDIEMVYSTLHQPFQDDESESFYSDSPSDPECSESYWSSDYEDSETPETIFEWDEDYCLDTLFSPSSGTAGTSSAAESFTLGEIQPSTDEVDVQTTLTLHLPLDAGDELPSESLLGGAETEKGKSDSKTPNQLQEAHPAL